MHYFEKKRLLFAPADGLPFIADKSDKHRRALVEKWLPMMHRSQKFIFDSGSDRDERTTQAVRTTAVDMMEMGLFHLPYSTVWIEDPFDRDPDETRNYYLAEEKQDTITFWLFQRHGESAEDPATGELIPLSPNMPRYVIHPNPMVIDLREPKDTFQLLGAVNPHPVQITTYGEAAYALKKFLVTLATKQAVRETVPGGDVGAHVAKQSRRYPFTIVRVPIDLPSGAGAERGPGAARRSHLVRGHVWGKHARPKAEWRWIEPYWRGEDEPEHPSPPRDHYEIKSR